MEYNSNYGGGYGQTSSTSYGSYQGGYSQPASAPAIAQPEADTFGWDDQPLEQKDFITLKPGVYKYRIKSWDKGRYQGGDKIGPCPQTILHVEIDTPDGTAVINDTIFMLNRNKWKIAQLMISIGIAPNPDGTVTPNWLKLSGATGFCEVKNTKSDKNPDVVFNNIAKYLPPNGNK